MPFVCNQLSIGGRFDGLTHLGIIPAAAEDKDEAEAAADEGAAKVARVAASRLSMLVDQALSSLCCCCCSCSCWCC